MAFGTIATVRNRITSQYIIKQFEDWGSPVKILPADYGSQISRLLPSTERLIFMKLMPMLEAQMTDRSPMLEEIV